MTTTTTGGATTLMSATPATAMVAGLLFSFAHSVMPGLGTLGDRGFLTAFQRIDAAISNPMDESRSETIADDALAR
ncbi:MAG: hypothetical protein ACRDUV_09720 [Pseudonocardiaceae bacterium]